MEHRPLIAREKLLSLLAQANEFKEGDLLIGGTADSSARAKAKEELSSLTISDIASTTLVDDQVTRAVKESVDPTLAAEIASMALSDLKETLLSADCASWVRRYQRGLQSEVIAAVVRLLSNEELSKVSLALYNPLCGDEVAIGSAKHFGSRIQPNSPGDDPEEILLSTLEGLSYGCGDVIIGLNPASDRVEDIVKLERTLQSIVEGLKLPTRFCVLSDMPKQFKARRDTKVDVGFQSLSGTSKGLVGMIGVDVEELCELCRSFDGLYFETGQGSGVTNMVAEGIDMVTLEGRCYGLARYIIQKIGAKWVILNDVSGFIGPEVYKTSAQLYRACLEDTVMGKLHGLIMGLDICSTFHMGIDPFELQSLTELIVEKAAPAYIMAVAGKADPMLGYLTTSFKEHPRIRGRCKKQIAGAMDARLRELGVTRENAGSPEIISQLYAAYKKAMGDERSEDILKAEGRMKLEKMQVRGFDLGRPCGSDASDPEETKTRLTNIYQNARSALRAKISSSAIAKCCPSFYAASTLARSRDAYIGSPSLGEQLVDADCENLKKLFGLPPQILLVVSDGLNANAVNAHLPELIPALHQKLAENNLKADSTSVVISNGRVRAGYHVGTCTRAAVIVHFIGERPGTGLDQLSAYITYGGAESEPSKWSIAMDHSLTTAICGIHPKGKTIAAAVEEIVTCILNAMKYRTTGVALTSSMA